MPGAFFPGQEQQQQKWQQQQRPRHTTITPTITPTITLTLTMAPLLAPYTIMTQQNEKSREKGTTCRYGTWWFRGGLFSLSQRNGVPSVYFFVADEDEEDGGIPSPKENYFFLPIVENLLIIDLMQMAKLNEDSKTESASRSDPTGRDMSENLSDEDSDHEIPLEAIVDEIEDEEVHDSDAAECDENKYWNDADLSYSPSQNAFESGVYRVIYCPLGPNDWEHLLAKKLTTYPKSNHGIENSMRELLRERRPGIPSLSMRLRVMRSYWTNVKSATIFRVANKHSSFYWTVEELSVSQNCVQSLDNSLTPAFLPTAPRAGSLFGSDILTNHIALPQTSKHTLRILPPGPNVAEASKREVSETDVNGAEVLVMFDYEGFCEESTFFRPDRKIPHMCPQIFKSFTAETYIFQGSIPDYGHNKPPRNLRTLNTLSHVHGYLGESISGDNFQALLLNPRIFRGLATT
ncbi:hypothetical protein BO71DRAFT_482293 [Aspergillus ellipticus CBS 707.79]|uniref:Uncharacterized protein n=1 Tax=Aspergillus ellipticus CBS 707.79 TaxID=1448320 RepID=A0A319EWT9_9EURO|nr:hypothetical protein BO71DRAFT_482293 [Aspergillus ellipticus CBS 707.79]